MPSNPTLPDEVQALIIGAQTAEFHEEANAGHSVSDTAEECFECERQRAIAPLIIDWARRDQAERDAETSELKIGLFGESLFEKNKYAIEIAKDIRAQFPTTDETTGETTK